MANKVVQWKSRDGKLHTSRKDAEWADVMHECREVLEGCRNRHGQFSWPSFFKTIEANGRLARIFVSFFMRMQNKGGRPCSK
jgi:hypothetical protein